MVQIRPRDIRAPLISNPPITALQKPFCASILSFEHCELEANRAWNDAQSACRAQAVRHPQLYLEAARAHSGTFPTARSSRGLSRTTTPTPVQVSGSEYYLLISSDPAFRRGMESGFPRESFDMGKPCVVLTPRQASGGGGCCPCVSDLHVDMIYVFEGPTSARRILRSSFCVTVGKVP